MTLQNYHWKDFVMCQKIFSNFSQPIRSAKSIFQPIWAIFGGHHTLHGTHSSQTHSTIQHPNMYSSTIMQHNQRNTPVIMHPNNVFILWHLKMIQIFIWPYFMKIPFMSLCHIRISQTWYLSGANCMLHHKSCKYHTKITNYSNLPTHVPRPLLIKSNVFTFFIFDPMVAQLKIHKCLILSYAYHLPPISF